MTCWGEWWHGCPALSTSTIVIICFYKITDCCTVYSLSTCTTTPSIPSNDIKLYTFDLFYAVVQVVSILSEYVQCTVYTVKMEMKWRGESEILHEILRVTKQISEKHELIRAVSRTILYSISDSPATPHFISNSVYFTGWHERFRLRFIL